MIRCIRCGQIDEPVLHDDKACHLRPKVLRDVENERWRQVATEGWSISHDDATTKGQMAAAAGCYALHTDAYPNAGQPPADWPWPERFWKPKDYRRDLVRAAALIVAEIERIDRQPAPQGDATPEAG